MRMFVPFTLAVAAALALSGCKKEEEAAAPPRPVLSMVVAPTALPGTRFAGTVQAYVPLDMLDAFKAEMQSVFGEKSCYVLSVRSAGGTKVTIE